MRNIIRALPQGRGPLSFPCKASRLVPIGSHLGASARCREVDDPFGAGVALAQAARPDPVRVGVRHHRGGPGAVPDPGARPTPPPAARPPRPVVLGPSAVPGRHPAPRWEAPQPVAMGYHLTTAQHGPVTTAPARGPAAGPRGLAPSGTEGSGGGGTVPGMGLAPPQGTEGEERPYAIART